jgi:hypothetical protein
MNRVEIKKPKLLSPLVPLGLFALGIVFVMVPSPIAILCFIGGLLTSGIRVMQAVSHFRGHKEEYIAQAPLIEAEKREPESDDYSIGTYDIRTKSLSGGSFLK